MSVDAVYRLERIRAVLENDGMVKVAELADELEVSEMTVRRDLDALAEAGVVRRIRGGALAIGPQPFADRYGRQAKAKDRIASKLLEVVGGGAIGIDASTTLQRFAARLAGADNLTVVTNSIESFAVLQTRPGVTALLTGGQLDARTGSLVGPMANRSAHDVLLQQLFVSAAGLDPEHGTTEATLEEAEVKLELAAVASEVIVAVDSSKLGQRGAARCLAPARVAALVTELSPRDRRLDPYRETFEIV